MGEWLGHWLEVGLEGLVQLSGAQDLKGALITAGFFGLWWLWSWHRRQRGSGKPGVEPHHLILFGLIGGAVCLTAAAGGYAWQQFWWHPLVSGVLAQQHQAVSTTPTIEPKLGILYRPDLPNYYEFRPYPANPPASSGVIVFFRIKLINLVIGTTAHDVKAYVDVVERRIDGEFKPITNGIPYPLRLGPDKVDLVGDGEGKFIEFLHGQRVNTPDFKDTLLPDFIYTDPDRMIFTAPGLYRITVFASADGIRDLKKKFILKWTGSVDDIELSEETVR